MVRHRADNLTPEPESLTWACTDFASVDQLEGELNLSRGSGGFADDAEAGTLDGIRGQAHVDDVEEVEELATELKVGALDAAVAMGDGRGLDEREVEVVVGRSAKGVAAQGAEAAGVRSGAAGDSDGDGEVAWRCLCRVQSNLRGGAWSCER